MTAEEKKVKAEQEAAEKVKAEQEAAEKVKAEQEAAEKVKAEQEAAEKVKAELKQFEVVGCVRLNVRSGANKDSSILDVISAGSQVTVKATREGWARITTPDGVKGFVMEEFIKEV